MRNQAKVIDKSLELGLGAETYSELVNKTSQIVEQAKLLANSVQEVLNITRSQIYLETIYIPFLAHFMQFRELIRTRRPSSQVFRNFNEFHDYFYYHDTCTPNWLNFDWHWQEGEYDFIAAQPINIYEKLVYKVFGISYLELKTRKLKGSIDIKPDFELRLALENLISRHTNVFPDPDIIDFLPMTLLEGLKSRLRFPKYPFAAVHWLGQIHNENYLFFLAYLRDRGALIIGQPHAGCMGRMKFQFGNQIAEMILSDVYHSPMWGGNLNAFPDLRASRNLFINLKHVTRKKTKKKMLVIMPGFYTGQRQRYFLDKMFYAENISNNSFLHRQLKDLLNHFSLALDFKPGLKQVNFAAEFSYLKEIYPYCDFVTDISVQEVSRSYEGIIHLVTWGTAIMELAGTDIPQYVYLGPEILLNKEYESFLWNFRKSSTRKECSKGTWIQIDNKKLKLACGASYLYPFHFAKLIKSLIKHPIKKI